MKNIALLFLISLFCGCNFTDYTEDLGNGYIFGHESIDLNFILGKGGAIPADVIAWGYNEDFIIAKQKPEKKDPPYYFEEKWVYPLGRDTTYYWVIIKQKHEVLGPLNYDGFEQVKKDYHIPETLTMTRIPAKEFIPIR